MIYETISNTISDFFHILFKYHNVNNPSSVKIYGVSSTQHSTDCNKRKIELQRMQRRYAEEYKIVFVFGARRIKCVSRFEYFLCCASRSWEAAIFANSPIPFFYIIIRRIETHLVLCTFGAKLSSSFYLFIFCAIHQSL